MQSVAEPWYFDVFDEMDNSRTTLLHRVLRVWHALWGLPQTILGLALWLALGKGHRHGEFRSAYVKEWRLRAGLSMGMFIFVPQGTRRPLLLHEYGHTIQSLMLGPLYLLVVVIPSVVWAGVPRLERMRSQRRYSYYRFYTERWANLLVHRLTHEEPEGW